MTTLLSMYVCCRVDTGSVGVYFLSENQKNYGRLFSSGFINVPLVLLDIKKTVLIHDEVDQMRINESWSISIFIPPQTDLSINLGGAI